jgi:glycosyltransferase involved in cell wall biosynthesis
VRFLLRAVWYLLRHGRRYDAILLGDVVLAPMALAARLAGARGRIVVAAHGTDVAYGLRSGPAPGLYRCFLRLVGLTAGALDATIANSRATAGHCRAAGLPGVQVVPLGVASVDAVPDTPPAPYVLFVGRIDRRKGAGWFAREVMPRLPGHLRFKVAGTVWNADEAAILDACARTEVVGPVFGEALARLRREAVCVVVPNIPLDGKDFEGFGLTAVEASAQGAVLLAARLDGITDALVDGVTGFSLPAGRADAWALRIAEIDAWSPSDRRSFLARSTAATAARFTWDRVAERTLEVLLGVPDASAPKKLPATAGPADGYPTN